MISFLSALCIGIGCAVISVTMIVIMSNEPILNWWFKLGEKYGKDIIQGMEHERWFYRPIWGCEKCFAGQLALWFYFFGHIKANSPMDWQDMGWFNFPGYSLFNHITTTCVAIFTAVILSHIINKIKNDNEH